MSRAIGIGALSLALAAAPLMPVGAASAADVEPVARLTAKANHDHIQIDFAYHGSAVTVRGEAEEGVDLVIKIASPDGHEVMKKKGKVAGLLWMNVGSLSFEKVPSLYEVFGTRDVAELLAAEDRIAHGIGYDALEHHAEVSPTGGAEEKARWFRELVALKESSGLYAESWGRIETRSLGNGRQEYLLATDWPHQAPPGTYTVTVFAVKEGTISDEARCSVHVEQVGLVKALASMARESAVLYAVVSIGVALSAGFGVGMVLRKGGGAH